MTIQAFNADYVLSVLYSPDDPAAAKLDFERLITTLTNAGFLSQVRYGHSSKQLLLFIKLTNYKFAELAEQDLIRNYEFGITNSTIDQSARLRIIYNYLTTPKDVAGLEITPLKGDWNFVSSIFPVSVKSNVAPLLSKPTTSDLITQFGYQIGLYFEFFNYYLVNLFGLSIIGLITYFSHHYGLFSLSYTFINLVWGLIFICGWEKPQSYLASFYGLENCHQIDTYYGELATINRNFETKSTFKHDKKFDDSSRFVKQLWFIPIGLFFTLVLVSYQLTCFVTEIFLSEIYNGPGKSVLTLLPTVMISVFVPVLSIVYNKVVDKVIAWENHDNSLAKNNSILFKQFVLNFLTSYMPLIITSFVYLPFAHLIQPQLPVIKSLIDDKVNQSAFYYKYISQVKRQEDFKINQQRLSTQYFYFIVTNQVIQLILKYAVPFLTKQSTKLYAKYFGKSSIKPIDNPQEVVYLNIIRDQAELPVYDVNDDYRSLVTQYGYLIIFGPVWPLAPLISLVFNLIVLKLDTFKLSSGTFFKPPVPVRVDSIRPWNHALFGLTWIASVISPIITMFYRHGLTPPKTLGQFTLSKASVHVSSTTKLVFILFVAEHGFLALYFIFSKLHGLYKTDIEWNNDFTENDIKLRRDYYSDKVEPTFQIDDKDFDEKKWSNNAQDTINQAEKLNLLRIKQREVEKKKQELKHVRTKSGIKETTSATTTSATKGDATGLTSRSAKNEPASLASQRAYLNSVKDDQDEIIETHKDGKTTLSTLDHHGHIDPPSDHDATKILATERETNPLANADYKNAPVGTVNDSLNSMDKSVKSDTGVNASGFGNASVGDVKSSLSSLDKSANSATGGKVNASGYLGDARVGTATDSFKTLDKSVGSATGGKVSAAAFIGDNARVDAVPALVSAKLNNGTKGTDGSAKTTGNIGNDLNTSANNDASTRVAPAVPQVTNTANSRESVPATSAAAEPAPKVAAPITQTESSVSGSAPKTATPIIQAEAPTGETSILNSAKANVPATSGKAVPGVAAIGGVVGGGVAADSGRSVPATTSAAAEPSARATTPTTQTETATGQTPTSYSSKERVPNPTITDDDSHSSNVSSNTGSGEKTTSTRREGGISSPNPDEKLTKKKSSLRRLVKKAFE